MSDVVGRVGLLWRGDSAARATRKAPSRLQPIFDALAARNVSAEPVVFSEDIVDEAREQLLRLDGVLVWVDPITDGHDRSRLDALLREASTAGVWVSAHPDVIQKMGTKEVLVQTRDLGWCSDTHLYRTLKQFEGEFPARLAATGPRVVKQYRGNGGIGVWKVELVEDAPHPDASGRAPAASGEGAVVRVQHAHPRDTATETLPLAAFIERCSEYFSDDGRLIDQPFQPRITDGMIRCYLVQNDVIGFAHQSPATPPSADAAAGASPGRVFGLPAAKTMYDAAEPRFGLLKTQMESQWVPSMQRIAGVDDDALPLLWDADFLYGPKTAAGDDSYVLCEINVSCVTPFPEPAVAKLADAVAARLNAGA